MTDSESLSRLVKHLRTVLTPYWRMDIIAITSKVLAQKLSPLYANMELLSRDTKSAWIEQSNEIQKLRKDLEELRKILSEKKIVGKYEISAELAKYERQYSADKESAAESDFRGD